MLRPGTPAPDIVLNDQRGEPFTLSHAWRSGKVVLFFYPKADTPVCTKEACAFRDAFADLKAKDVTIVGISRDGSEAQQAFAQKWNLPFTLLADVEGRAHAAYKASGLFGIIPGRITYLIDRGGTILNSYSALFGSDAHVQNALEVLDQGKV
jgi:peroxiredoxin Q/BCP